MNDAQLIAPAAGTMIVLGADAGGILPLQAPQFQVGDPIVIADPVLVVDPLMGEQIAPELLFHDETMFSNISAAFMGLRMFGNEDGDVAVLPLDFSSPIRSFLGALCPGFVASAMTLKESHWLTSDHSAIRTGACGDGGPTSATTSAESSALGYFSCSQSPHVFSVIDSAEICRISRGGK